MRRKLGLFFSLGKVIGVLFVIVLELILTGSGVVIEWRIILSMTAVFSVLQAIFMYFFGSHTPSEMFEKGRPEEARFYSAISPIYLKEIAPKELRRKLGLFFSLGKVIGVLFVIALELILTANGVVIEWRIILSMTAVFSALQAIFMYFFGSHTPSEMFENGRPEEARKII
ncbi:unnamed protein product [Sphagnum balticum]